MGRAFRADTAAAQRLAPVRPRTGTRARRAGARAARAPRGPERGAPRTPTPGLDRAGAVLGALLRVRGRTLRAPGHETVQRAIDDPVQELCAVVDVRQRLLGHSELQELAQGLPAFAHVPDEQPL